MLGVVGSDPSASLMPPGSLSWPCKWSLKERAAKLCMVSAGSELENNALSRAPALIHLSEEETSSFSNEAFSGQKLFDDWMVSLCLYHRKMLAVILIETFKNRMKLTVKDDAMQVGSAHCRAHTGTNFTLVNLQK